MVKIKESPDLMAVGAAGAVFLVTLGWAVWASLSARSDLGKVPTLSGADLVVESGGIPVGPLPEVDWPVPAESPDPAAWTFDVFTPPRIFFDPATGRFSVSAPEAVELDQEPLVAPFGISLLAVERQPYRLQLVGYAGAWDDPWGIFANEDSGEGVVAQQGFRFLDLGLEIRKLEIRREDLIVPESMPLREIVAVALVHDQREQRTVRLTSGFPAWTDRPKATVLIESTGERRRVEAGNRIELDDAIIEITGVFTGPDALTAVKTMPAGVRETIRLVPDSGPDVQFESDTVF